LTEREPFGSGTTDEGWLAGRPCTGVL